MEPTIAPLAVIDLGTNTFHLLIASPPDEHGRFEEIYRERRFIKLAEAGIERIGEAPYHRAMEALLHYRKIMDRYGVEQYRAMGTAALRTASNGPNLIAEAREKAGIEITSIPGEEEARLISKGVLAALPPLSAERILIMDIGGGSVEFIIADQAGTHWAQSFPVGVAVLRRQFHHQEPMAATEIQQLEAFLEAALSPLWAALERYPTHHLVGAAGTFDVIALLMSTGQPTPNSHTIDLEKFQAFYDRCVASTLAERFAMPQLPTERADMIVVALVLVQYISQKADIRHLSVSEYAMKEGVLSEMKPILS